MRMTDAARTWWEERALPRLVDVALSDVTSRPWRELVCGTAAGRVLEVGFASGKNLEYYPPEVSEVLAVEPADLAWERAADRIAAFGRPVRRIGPDGAHLAVPDASVDVVVSAWTMCTIPDLKASVREMHRVLRPGGSVRFVEHVRSDHPRALRIQEDCSRSGGPSPAAANRPGHRRTSRPPASTSPARIGGAGRIALRAVRSRPGSPLHGDSSWNGAHRDTVGGRRTGHVPDSSRSIPMATKDLTLPSSSRP